MRGSIRDEGGDARPPALAVGELGVVLEGRSGPIRIVDGVTFEIGAGETLGMTGPSGAGKSAIAFALLGLASGGLAISAEGSIRLNGRELVGLDEAGWSTVRGREIGLIPQDPGASLTPVRRVGDLLAEVLDATSAGAGKRDAGDLLAEVGFEDPVMIESRFPYELSGGMRQRVAIAAALAGEPSLLVADEPTSSLDAIAGKQIMDLLASIQRRHSMAMLLISHDRRALTRSSDRLVELRGGSLAPCREVRPEAPPRAAAAPGSVSERQPPGARGRSDSLLEIDNLQMTFRKRGFKSRTVPAIACASLDIGPGESVGLVGPTGSGKSTLARCAARLLEPTGGTVSIKGQDVTRLSQRRLRPLRKSIGMVFQNPSASLNPCRRLGEAIATPLRIQRIGGAGERSELVRKAAESARLSSKLLDRRPDELSGGELQRGALARALVTDPELLILDEPFTALDEETQSELVDLLAGMREERGLALLLITHDMRLVAGLTERIAVMDAGRIIESGGTGEVVGNPVRQMTKDLVTASFRP